MAKDPNSPGFSDYMDGFRVEDFTFQNGFEFNAPGLDLSLTNMNVPAIPPESDPGPFVPPVTAGYDGVSFSASPGHRPVGESYLPSDNSDSTDPVFKYISQMLVEENMQDKPYIFDDYLALEDTEKPLYEVLGEQYHPSNQSQPSVNENMGSPDSNLSGSNGHSKTSFGTSNGTSNNVDHHRVGEVGGPASSLLQAPVSGDCHLQPTLQKPSSKFSVISTKGLSDTGNGLIEPPVSELLAQNIFTDKESVLQFQKGFEEASKFLPSGDQLIIDLKSNTFPMGKKGNVSKIVGNAGKDKRENSADGLTGRKNHERDKESILLFQRGFEEASKFLPSSDQLIIDLESNTFPMGKKGNVPKVAGNAEKDKRENSADGLTGRKNHERDDWKLEEERSNKQSATYTEESDLSDAFDKVLLCTEVKAMCGGNNETVRPGETNTLQHKEQSNGSSTGKFGSERTRSKQQGEKKEMVDLWTLLICCAQAVSVDDRNSAGELLKQIKDHSSHLGDGTQRLAYFFANGLEARLDGSRALIHSFYTSLASKKMTAADILEAYKSYLCTCPFVKLAISFAKRMICCMSEKASALHIVDFGILYGFQWPILIQILSNRPGGPPKLRITGIEIPQRGFHPAERIEETGRRLAKYCERFNVPFEYNPITAENWETIQVEDFKINSSEMLAVNSLFRFQNLLDETVGVEDCPKDAVLKLIWKINPDIFVHSIVNGSYNAPIFIRRFKEALFHLSAVFDMFESTLPREDPARLMFEREFYGREIMNVIACEGSARVQRPETYKQWQIRTIRAGFKPLVLDQELMKTLREKLKACYHKDFVIEEDNHWMLQGWKGRLLCGSSCWIRAQES